MRKILLWSTKLKNWLIQIPRKEGLQTHKGSVLPQDIEKALKTGWVKTSKHESLFISQPLLREYLPKIERESQIVYGKDAGAIIVLADIFCGAKVLEVGTGSGAMTLMLSRFLGKEGEIISIDERKSAIKKALANIQEYQRLYPDHPWPKIRFYNKSIEEVKRLKKVDSVIVDIPEPYLSFEVAFRYLKNGRPLVFVVPTVNQIIKATKIAKQTGFVLAGIFEILEREWQIKPRSLRPKDRMIAHTLFLVRLIKPGA